MVRAISLMSTSARLSFFAAFSRRTNPMMQLDAYEGVVALWVLAGDSFRCSDGVTSMSEFS